MTQTTVYLASPESDQAVALYRLLSAVGHDVVGVLDPGNTRASRRSALPLVRAEDLPTGVRVIPTGHASTQRLLAAGDIEFDHFSFRQESQTLSDKATALEVAHAAGVPIPETWHSPEEVPAEVTRVFYKEAAEAGGGRRGLMSREQLHTLGTGLIYQEYIDSPGTYGVAFVAHDGKLLVSHSHHEMTSFPRLGGSAIAIRRFESDELLRSTAAIVTSTKYSGWGLAEYKWCPRRQRFVFMEVNAKLWASLEFTFRSEPKFLQLLTGQPVKTPAVADTALFCHRAVQAGPAGLVETLKYARHSPTLICYRLDIRSLVRAVIPSSVVERLRRSRNAR